MTLHFKRFLVVSGLFVILLSGLFFYLKSKIKDVTPVRALPTNVKEQVSFNEKTHTLTVQTSKGVVKEYAKNPDVTIMKNGAVKIQRHLFGLENSPFLGLGYADCGRIFIGDNLFHVSRFDLSGSIGIVPDSRHTLLRPYFDIGYNFYSNTSFNLAIDPLTIYTVPQVAGFISVKF
jgi:hypothetical protein